MAQLSSNTLVYDQIFFKIREFLRADTSSQYRTVEERATAYNKLLQEIYENVSQPLTNFQPLIKGEPPISAKFNSYSEKFAEDLNILARQIDYITAKTVNIFNLFTTEMENEKKYLERIGSKTKILQMYSRSPSNDLVYYGDSFDNMDKVDVSRIRSRYMPVISNGQCTLPIVSSRIVSPKLVYANRQEGFLGNNHQVKRVVNSEGTSEYRYVFEDAPTLSQVSSITDSNPLSFFELETLNVDKTSSGAEVSLISENEFCFLRESPSNPTEATERLINWSNYDVSKPFKASVIIEYNTSKANCIEIVPYFGSSKFVKVSQIQLTKRDGTTVDILKAPLYIGSSFAPLNQEISKNYFYNQALVNFSELDVSKAEVFFEQENYEITQIGHVYWKPNYPANTNVQSPFVGLPRFSPDTLSKEIYEEVEYDKFSLIPRSVKPNEFKVNGKTAKTIKVRVKTKSQSYKFWVISFNRNKRNDSPDVGKVKSYFFDWNDSIANTASGFKYLDEIRLIDGKLTAKGFTSEQEAQSDLDAFRAFIASRTASGVIIGVDTFDITDITLEQVSFNDSGYVFNYDVPIISDQEIYSAKRMAIGLRDITLRYDVYAAQAELVSKPFLFDKNVEALMLSVETDVDNTMSDMVSMKYYVSVDGGKWILISPVQLDNVGIAEVIVFNKNLTESGKLPGVAYLNHPDVPQKINQVLVKIEFSKARSLNVTPSIYSYELIAKVES